MLTCCSALPILCTANKPQYCYSTVYCVFRLLVIHLATNVPFFSRIHLTWENSLCDYCSEKRDQLTLTHLAWVTTLYHNSVDGPKVASGLSVEIAQSSHEVQQFP